MKCLFYPLLIASFLVACSREPEVEEKKGQSISDTVLHDKINDCELIAANDSVAFLTGRNSSSELAQTVPYGTYGWSDSVSYTPNWDRCWQSQAACAPPCAPCCPCDCQNDCCIDLSCINYLVIPSFWYRAGRGRGYRNGVESVELFLAASEPNLTCYPFLDLRAHRIGGGTLAGNIGLGWRSFSPDYCEMFGANIYYDYRRVRHGNLHQLGLGLEYFWDCWELRANAYIPVSKKRIHQRCRLFNFGPGINFLRREFIEDFWGFDFELGRDLFCTSCFDVYAGIGPYFYGRDCCNFAGGMGRVALFFGCYWTLQAYLTYDRLFGTTAQAEIILDLPFPFSCDCDFWRCWGCLFDYVWRNDIIVTHRNCCWERDF